MTKCPTCGWENEDGVHFCEKCKSDLARPAPSAPAPATGAEWPAVARAADTDLAARRRTNVHGGLADAHDPLALAGSLHLEQRGDSGSRHGVQPPASTPGRSVATDAILHPEAKPKLLVLRGEKLSVQYPIYPGKNYIGRTDEKPVDVDLENQETPDRILCSRQHAVITYENGMLTIEDLNSLNGTFINRTRIHPGQVRTLQVNDVIQIGTVHLKVILG